MFCIILESYHFAYSGMERPVSVTFFAASRRSILFRRKQLFARTSWFGGSGYVHGLPTTPCEGFQWARFASA